MESFPAEVNGRSVYYFFLVVVVVVVNIEAGNRSTNSTVGRDRIGERQDRGHCFYTQQEAATARTWVERMIPSVSVVVICSS